MKRKLSITGKRRSIIMKSFLMPLKQQIMTNGMIKRHPIPVGSRLEIRETEGRKP